MRKQILAYLAALLMMLAGLATAVPLDTFDDFMAAHRDEGRKGQWVQFLARGTGTNDLYVLEVDPTTGQIPVSATVSFSNDTDYGTVGSDTLRTAAQIGNATGAADFNTGAPGAQTLRVVTATGSEIKLTDGTDDLLVNADGSMNAVVTATDLDIRDLSDSSDSVSIGDGTDSVVVSAAGEMQVRDDDAITELETIAGAVSGTEMQVDVVASLPAGDNNIGNVDLASSIPAGNNNIGDVDVTNLPATVDTNSGAAGASTLRTVLATRHEAAATPVAVRISNGSAFTTPSPAGRSYGDSARNDYSSVNVTTGAWVQLIASTAATINSLQIFDSCGQVLELGTGAAASESRVLLIPPGGFDGPVPLAIASGTRVAIRAVSANCTSGQIVITGLN